MRFAKSVLAFASLCASYMVPASVPTLRPGLPLIFPDDLNIEARTNAVRVFHVATCDRTPALVADRPWEGVAHVYGSVNQEPDGTWRMWYNAWSMTLVADSKDGKTWTKPIFNVHNVKGHPTNNVVFIGHHSPAVIRDPFDKDPSRRYKCVGARLVMPSFGVVDKKQTGYYAATSPDGVHWSRDRKILDCCDTVTMAQNPYTGEYLVYHKVLAPLDQRYEERRIVWVSRSTDFEHWSKPQIALAPDEIDDEGWIDSPDQRTDIYDMPVFSHAGGFIGFPTVFRISSRYPFGPGAKFQADSRHFMDDGFIDVQLATSADGVEWHRTPGRKTVIRNGAPDSIDFGQIPGIAGGTPLTVGDETSLYYYAINKTHGKVMERGCRLCIGRATWRRWGFASLGCGSETGSFTTKPIALGTGDLRINMKPESDPRRRGESWVRLAVLSPDGSVLGETEKITGNDVLAKPVWKNGFTPPVGKHVKLRVEFRCASVYALECVR